MSNPQSCPAFSRPRNFGRRLLKVCPSLSSLAFSHPVIFVCHFPVSFSRPLVFFVRHFQVVHFQRPVCLKAMARKQWKNILSDMLVNEWTRVLCCSGLTHREVGRFRFSFREKTAGFWFGFA